MHFMEAFTSFLLLRGPAGQREKFRGDASGAICGFLGGILIVSFFNLLETKLSQSFLLYLSVLKD